MSAEPAPTRSWHVTASRAGPHVTAVILLQVLCGYWYSLSLKDADLRLFRTHVPTHARNLVLASASYTAALWATALSRSITKGQRVGLLCAAAALPPTALVYDHGITMEQHGLYSMLTCVLLLAPVNALAAACLLFTRLRKHPVRARWITGFIWVLLLALAVRLMQHRGRSVDGLAGTRVLPRACPTTHSTTSCPLECRWRLHIPWVDLLPNRALNFWTGSHSCPRPKPAAHLLHWPPFNATLSPDGLLVLDGCVGAGQGEGEGEGEGERYPCQYTVLPSSRLWAANKTMDQIYTRFARAVQTRTYTAPVLLPEAEAVLATRGTAERRLLLRVMDMLPHRPDLQPQPQLGAHLSDAPPHDAASELPAEMGNQTEHAEHLTGLQEPLAAGSQQKCAVDQPGVQQKGVGGGIQAQDATGHQPQAGQQCGAAGGQQQEKMNVLLLFLDSVSRRNFHRKLPKTCKAMEQVHASAHTRLFEFFRYHSVGWNTFRNSRAMFAGLEGEDDYGQTPIWASYRRNGYMTGYISNCCNDWNADYNGGPQPDSVDHELLSPFCLPEYYGYHPFRGAYSMARRCLAGRHAHTYNFDYMRAFMQRYDGAVPWFLASVLNEGHEGTGEVLTTVDSDLAAFLGGIPAATWNRTVVLVVADHGLHMGLSLLFTNAGKVEHLNPFMAVLLPPWLGDAVQGEVEGNQQKLVTAWDVYATLNHVLHWPGGQDHGRWAARSGLNESMVHWGRSLLEAVPAGRTCEGLGIEEFCMCRDMAHRDEL